MSDLNCLVSAGLGNRNKVSIFYSLRTGQASDNDWLFSLYCQALRPAIEKTWGWDEVFQRNNFSTHLSPEKFDIMVLEGKPIGGFMMDERKDYLWLEMLLINPDYQRKGIGSKVMKQLQQEAITQNKPLKLSVIKANPVKPFYEKLGFMVEAEDKAFFQLIWLTDNMNCHDNKLCC